MPPNVAAPSAEVKKLSMDWALADALLGGTDAMRKAGEKYLPRWPQETPGAYKLRLSTAVLFPSYKRTVATLSAKPFSKPITMGEDIPPAMLEWLKDVDMEGRNFDSFAGAVLECAVGFGLCGILVDYPQASGFRTKAEEAASGVRPYMVHIKPEQLLGWRAVRAGTRWLFEQLRIMECVSVPDGEFASVDVKQVRVIEPKRWAVYRKGMLSDDWILHQDGINTLGFVPFVPVYGKYIGFMLAEPPLKEVAHLNIAHWQSLSDQQTILHVARVPILVASGVDEDGFALTVGASECVKLTNPAAKLYFAEHSGASIAAGRQELADLEERMRQAGAELLVISRGRVTATQIATENAMGMCALQKITLAFEDALDLALQYMAMWAGLESGGHVTLFNDYGAATLEEASAGLLLQVNMAGKLSDETLHAELQRRGIVAADVSWDIELARLGAQGPPLGQMGQAEEGPPEPTAAPEPAPPVLPAPAPAPLPQPPDFGPLIAAMQMVASSNDKPTTINVTTPDVRIEAPVTVNVPEQQPSTVNVAPAAVTVNTPDVNVAGPTITIHTPDVKVESPTINVTTPDITIEPAQVVVQPATINVAQPNVHVTVERGGKAKFTEDAAGNITGAEIE